MRTLAGIIFYESRFTLYALHVTLLLNKAFHSD
nr:MAG TPA: hypothetical protein [Bacteriophage sp.]